MPRQRRGWAMNHIETDQISHSPLIISMLEPVLLFLIKKEPRHGYSLLSDLSALDMGTIHPGVVYRTLRELEALGWIESYWDTDQTQGPPRRTYHLTDKGNLALINWQGELEKVNQIIKSILK